MEHQDKRRKARRNDSVGKRCVAEFTNLVAPMPEIRLTAEHIAVEYHAVKFQKENANLWLPHSAEVYFDWRGQRVHRRHAFDSYLLFSIDSSERIGGPKEQKPADPSEHNVPSPPS